LFFPITFPFLQKKKKTHRNSVILNDIVLLLPCACKGREKEDFKSFLSLSLVVTHFWVPTNKKKIYNNNNNNNKKKEFEQCRFDTVPLPAALHAVGAEPRQ
jgi:hypothetical protein